MRIVEIAKKAAERVSGIGKPTRAEARKLVRRRKPKTYRLQQSGLVPNNAKLPFVVSVKPVLETSAEALSPS